MAFTLLRKLESGVFGDFQWYGTYRYRCPNSEADALLASYLGTEFSSARPSAIYVPVAVTGRADKNARVSSEALVTIQYKSLRRPNTATLKGANRSSPVKVLYDLDNKVIEGNVESATGDIDGVNTNRVASGSNVVGKANETLVVQACYDTLNLTTPRSWRNKVNAGYMAKLGADAGILLLWDVVWYPVYAGPNTRFYFDYYFRVSPYEDSNGNILPWNSGCTTKAVAQMITEVPVLDVDMADTGDVSRKRVPVSDYYWSGSALVKSARGTTRLFNTADMSALDSIIII